MSRFSSSLGRTRMVSTIPRKRRQLCKITLMTLPFIGVFCFLLMPVNQAGAALVVKWDSFTAMYGPFPASGGVSANSAKQLTTNTTSPFHTSTGAPPGSSTTFISNGWAGGANTKYWQVEFVTTNFTSLTVSSKQMSTDLTFSGWDGPRDFKLQYSLNGSTWTDVTGGALTLSGDWTAGGTLINLALPAACNNQPSVYLRWIMNTNNSVGTDGFRNNARNNIADIIINGTDVPQAPTDIALSNNTIPASSPISTLVGNFTVTDPNPGDTHTITLAAGAGSTDNSKFTIANGNELHTTQLLSAGTYSIRVNAYDGTYNYAEVFAINVTQYPTLTLNNSETSDTIHQVVFASINNTSGIEAGGYGDYSAQSTSINRGAPANLTVWVGSTWAGAPQGMWSIKAFFDWNHDLDFTDAGEGLEVQYNIPRASIANPGYSPFTKSITIPANAALGNTRMRVVYRWHDNADYDVPSFGGSASDYGEAEDYTVNISNIAPTFVGSTTTLTVNQNASATDIKGLLHVSDTDASQTETWTQSAAPSHGTLSISGATASSGSTDITPGGTITYTPNAGYSGSDSFTVQVSDGSDSATRTITVSVNAAPAITSANNTTFTAGSAGSFTVTTTGFPTGASESISGTGPCRAA